jgi:hypothetical protein
VPVALAVSSTRARVTGIERSGTPDPSERVDRVGLELTYDRVVSRQPGRTVPARPCAPCRAARRRVAARHRPRRLGRSRAARRTSGRPVRCASSGARRCGPRGLVEESSPDGPARTGAVPTSSGSLGDASALGRCSGGAEAGGSSQALGSQDVGGDHVAGRDRRGAGAPSPAGGRPGRRGAVTRVSSRCSPRRCVTSSWPCSAAACVPPPGRPSRPWHCSCGRNAAASSRPSSARPAVRRRSSGSTGWRRCWPGPPPATARCSLCSPTTPSCCTARRRPCASCGSPPDWRHPSRSRHRSRPRPSHRPLARSARWCHGR